MQTVLYWVSVFGVNSIDSQNSEVTKPAVKGLMLEHILYHSVMRYNHENKLVVKPWVCQ